MAAMREQLLAGIETYQTNQANVNSCIDRFSQMDTAAVSPLMMSNVIWHLVAASARLAQLADSMYSTIALTTHTCTQAQRWHVTDMPAEPMRIIIALSDVTTIARFSSTARPITAALRPIVRRFRLSKAVEVAGLSGVVRFDTQLDHGDVMKAMWMVEKGGEGEWKEAGEALRFAEHCGYCQLPITVSAEDLQTHATKADYSSLPRFCAQWMVVGRQVALRRPTGQQDGTLQLFRHNNEIRIIRNQPNFAITTNPPLPLPSRPTHPFSQHPFTHHAKPHDPPVRHSIVWQHGVGWTAAGANNVHASASSMLKRLLRVHRVLAVGGFTQSPAVVVDRSARGGHLDRIMTRSPHTPLNGCSEALTCEGANGRCVQLHALTTSDDPFISWIPFGIPPGNSQDVLVSILTSEAPAAGVPQDAPFAQRFPLTAAKARRVLGPIAPIVLDGQAP
ncbi:unnamed protein product [Vitrella brassicaformis CCMP3155]|uniref:Uncharacterized protein n=1 Tax=Vitrella brassicaformis (strain CCMP3155) TaxID=1169540 RepID=A0A0G4F6A5_VITBC|nr:unnamed protein product [Vitrella brassicaformis CCMP3155]|eukprot:CEM07554.1 unnamed protein product [Vitrella brassicaformis CCMP3155]